MRIHVNSRGAQWETGSKKGATGWRLSSGSPLQLLLLLSFSLSLSSVKELRLLSELMNIYRARARRINFATGRGTLRKIPYKSRGTPGSGPDTAPGSTFALSRPGEPTSSHDRRDENGASPRRSSRGYRAFIEIPAPSDKCQ